MYNYVMIFGLFFHNESSYINNGTVIMKRIPKSIPESCPMNMFLYSDDGVNSTRICECVPRFLYFPLNDSCDQPYRQGPCPSKNYLVLPENEKVARCVENPYLENGMVPYNVLSSRSTRPLRARTDIERERIYLPTEMLVQDILYSISKIRHCPRGSRRSQYLGMCRIVRIGHTIRIHK